MLTVAAVVEHLERLFPPRLAAEWDNVGLLLGDRAAPSGRLMTCLTVTPEVAAEAVERQAGLIVTHHPILFRAAKRLTADSAEGRMLLALAPAGVAVYSPHTAFDNAAGGINDLLAAAAGSDRRGAAAARRGAEAGQARRLRPGQRPGEGVRTPCSPPGRAASASTASAVSAWPAPARSSAPTRPTRPSARRAGARR